MTVVIEGCEFTEVRVGENVVFMTCSSCNRSVLWVPANDVRRLPALLPLHARRCLNRED